MTNDELIARFESDEIQETGFHHIDHVRLAFAYLERFPVLDALERFSAALKRFATARGKPERYHETITHAYVFLIRERMVRQLNLSWDEFAQNNPDLLRWQDGILSRYYNQSTLQSDMARRIFVFPDKFLP